MSGKRVQKKSQRCPGSHEEIAASWLPDDTGYPGAGICPVCSGGVLMLKGSTFKGENFRGDKLTFGKLRVHNRFDR